MDNKSTFEDFLSNGGLEDAARRGVAQAIAKLKAAGLTPINNGPLPVRAKPTNWSADLASAVNRPEKSNPAKTIHPDVIASNNTRALLSRADSR